MTTLRILLIVGLCAGMAGCGTKKAVRPETHPVSGKLLVDGKPAAKAQVSLYVIDEAKTAPFVPKATVADDGSFRLSTFTTNDGAPAGQYAVTVVWPGPRAKGQGEDEDGPDRLGNRYADPKRPAVRVTIAADTKDLDPIDLKLPVAGKKTSSVPKVPSASEM